MAGCNDVIMTTIPTYTYKPKENITRYERALISLIFPISLDSIGSKDVVLVEALPVEVKRHFEKRKRV